MLLLSTKLPLILAILLYILIYFLRLQQGGLDLKLDLFKLQREALDQKISQSLSSPQAELLSGILLGQNKNLPSHLKLALRDTSTLHIVVASGQNLSMVAGFFLSLAGLIKRKNAIVLCLLAVILYTLLTGLQIPILRAAVMFSLVSLAQLAGREKEGWWILTITGALLLLINPHWISDISFQLSFLATFGVVVVAPILRKYLNKLPQIISQDLAVTTGAQLMVMPIIIQNFHQLSVVSIFANILVGWTIPFIMILGGAMILSGFLISGLSFLIGLVTSVFLTYFIYIVHFFASLPFAWEYIGEQLWLVWAGYYLILAAVMLSLSNGQRKNSTRP